MAEEIDRGVTCKSLEDTRSFIFGLTERGEVPLLRGAEIVSAMDELLEEKGCIPFEELRRRRAEVSETLIRRVFERSPPVRSSSSEAPLKYENVWKPSVYTEKWKPRYPSYKKVFGWES